MILMSKITDGAGHGIESVQVILTTAPGSAFDATTGDEIASSQITETDADGSYSFEINNLTNVFPVGTYYKVRELIPNSYGGERLHTISSLPELGPVTLSSVKDGGTGSLTPSSVTITPVTVNPLDRQNHFGTQLAATISDFAIAVAAVGVGGSMTGAEILAALAPVDGSGSGLDADTLDGINSAGFDAAGAASSAETAAIVAAAASASATYATKAATTDLILAKGGRLFGTAAGTLANHAAPANGKFAVADSAQSDGWKDIDLPWHLSIDPVRVPAYSTVGGSIAAWATYYQMSNLNDEVVYNVQLGPGTWTFGLWRTTFSSYGILTVTLDATTIATLDNYTAGSVNPGQSLTTGIAIAASGVYALKLKTTSKNASSSNYSQRLWSMDFTRTA